MIVLSERGRKQRIDQVAFSPDGTLLVAAGNGSWAAVWRLDSPDDEPRRFLESEDPCAHVFAVAFWADGEALVAACGTRGLRAEPLSPVARPAQSCRSTGVLQSLAVSPDGRRVVGINNLPFQLFRQRDTIRPSFQSWVSDDGWVLREDWQREREHFSRNVGPVFLPTGARFLTTGHAAPDGFGERLDVSLSAFDAVSGNPVAVSSTAPYQSAEHLTCSREGQWIVAGLQHALGVWAGDDISQVSRIIRNDNRKHFTSIAFHPSERYLAATNNDQTVKLYDTTSWEVAKTYTWNIGRMRAVAFSPGGTLAAAGSDTGKVVVWDVDL